MSICSEPVWQPCYRRKGKASGVYLLVEAVRILIYIQQERLRFRIYEMWRDYNTSLIIAVVYVSTHNTPSGTHTHTHTSQTHTRAQVQAPWRHRTVCSMDTIFNHPVVFSAAEGEYTVMQTQTQTQGHTHTHTHMLTHLPPPVVHPLQTHRSLVHDVMLPDPSSAASPSFRLSHTPLSFSLSLSLSLSFSSFYWWLPPASAGSALTPHSPHTHTHAHAHTLAHTRTLSLTHTHTDARAHLHAPLSLSLSLSLSHTHTLYTYTTRGIPPPLQPLRSLHLAPVFFFFSFFFFFFFSCRGGCGGEVEARWVLLLFPLLWQQAIGVQSKTKGWTDVGSVVCVFLFFIFFSGESGGQNTGRHRCHRSLGGEGLAAEFVLWSKEVVWGGGGGLLSCYRYRSSRLPGAMAIDCIGSLCVCGELHVWDKESVYVHMRACASLIAWSPKYLEAPMCLCFLLFEKNK